MLPVKSVTSRVSCQVTPDCVCQNFLSVAACLAARACWALAFTRWCLACITSHLSTHCSHDVGAWLVEHSKSIHATRRVDKHAPHQAISSAAMSLMSGAGGEGGQCSMTTSSVVCNEHVKKTTLASSASSFSSCQAAAWAMYSARCLSRRISSSM